MPRTTPAAKAAKPAMKRPASVTPLPKGKEDVRSILMATPEQAAKRLRAKTSPAPGCDRWQVFAGNPQPQIIKAEARAAAMEERAKQLADQAAAAHDLLAKEQKRAAEAEERASQAEARAAYAEGQVLILRETQSHLPELMKTLGSSLGSYIVHRGQGGGGPGSPTTRSLRSLTHTKAEAEVGGGSSVVQVLQSPSKQAMRPKPGDAGATPPPPVAAAVNLTIGTDQGKAAAAGSSSAPTALATPRPGVRDAVSAILGGMVGNKTLNSGGQQDRKGNSPTT